MSKASKPDLKASATFFERLPVGTLLLDAEGRITVANPTLCRWLGRTPAELEGRTFPELLPVGQRLFYANHQALAEAIDGSALEMSYDLRCADGSVLPVLVTTEPLSDGDQIYVVYRAEIRRRYERQLLEAKKQAERAAKSRADFVRVLSHEVRTPVHAIVSMVEILESDPSPDSRAEVMQTLSLATRRLIDLVNDVLDLSKAESGKIVVVEGPVDLARLCDELLDTFRVQTKNKGLHLVGDYDELRGWEFSLDAGKIRQVLTNLLGNAIKFTEQGTVRLRIRGLEELALGRKARIDFEVQDSGTGISSADLERIFGEFEQSGAGMITPHSSGLGLPISRHIVGAMGGDLTARSEIGEGASFEFSLSVTCLGQLPVRTGAPTAGFPAGAGAGGAFPTTRDGRAGQAAKTPSLGRLPGLRVLHADDNSTNRFIARRHFEQWGISYAEASDGAGAIELAQAGEFDVLLLDLRMGAVDGVAAARAIRALDGYAQTPIYAVSAGSLPEDASIETDATLFSGLLSKPYSGAQLHALLSKHAPSVAASPPKTESPPPAQVGEDSALAHDGGAVSIDLSAMEQDFSEEDDQEAFVEFLGLILNDLTAAREGVVAAVGRQDVDFLKGERHRLTVLLKSIRPQPLERLLSLAASEGGDVGPGLAAEIDDAFEKTAELVSARVAQLAGA